MEEKRILYWNVQLWKWYFYYDKKGLGPESEREKAFTIMTMAADEDIRLFGRFVMYAANTRGRGSELEYKTLCHFLGLMHPDFALANMDLFLSMGKKSDVLYFMPAMPERISKWVTFKSKYDTDLERLKAGGDDFRGLMDSFAIDRRVRYRPKATKSYRWEFFFEKLASDPTLNGITAGSHAAEVILPELSE